MVGWQDSSNNFAGLAIYSNNGLNLSSAKGTKGATNYTITATYNNIATFIPFVSWVKIADDGTSRIISVSADGNVWVPFHTVAHTDFLTPTGVFFGIEARNSTFGASLLIDSWEEGSGA